MSATPTPQLGTLVLYRTDQRNGLKYDLPAIITCTADTHPGDYPTGQSNPLPVPPSPSHVHLTVFTPGGVGARVVHEDDETRTAVLPEEDHEWIGGKALIPGSGTYVELSVPRASTPEDPAPRTWRLP